MHFYDRDCRKHLIVKIQIESLLFILIGPPHVRAG